MRLDVDGKKPSSASLNFFAAKRDRSDALHAQGACSSSNCHIPMQSFKAEAMELLPLSFSGMGERQGLRLTPEFDPM